jgi:hypothetical protein
MEQIDRVKDKFHPYTDLIFPDKQYLFKKTVKPLIPNHAHKS